uniref:Uncharacterized protein n=1 Tax=Hyaloperonospora arabidopsidis (strain Emoy2) TaxID=559515 RepID=M4B9T4_HYAAE
MHWSVSYLIKQDSCSTSRSSSRRNTKYNVDNTFLCEQHAPKHHSWYVTCLKLADWIKRQLTAERRVQKDMPHMATSGMIQYKYSVYRIIYEGKKVQLSSRSALIAPTHWLKKIKRGSALPTHDHPFVIQI